ncbi:hypothetical protein [Ammoniphilus sp. CFH 90114]|uniref:hypothetical protein n=1 Tax=Ammoniphilus sp. CFH 90114 TaxID=2493665 RepID=UPI00100DFF86|nr:hypothetical protein [Ammoniphilus sp. CFH 90114]RXT04858.1 hypothetical protein EIZ39_19230 [Ammoniphilus sp. CFH 90114]
MDSKKGKAASIPLRTVVYSVSIGVFLLSTVFAAELFSTILSIAAIVCIAVSLPQSGKIAGSLSTLFLGIGFFVLWQSDVSTSTYLTSFGGMFNLLALFSIIPLIAVPIRVGGYSETIRHILESRIKSPAHLYRTISFYSFFLSCFMNLATLPMMYYSVKKAVEQYPLKSTSQFTSIGIIQGFALPILWTPIAPIVGVVFDLTHVNWLSMLPILLGLSVAGLLLNWALFQINQKKFLHSLPDGYSAAGVEIAAAVSTPDDQLWKHKLRQMSIAVLLFITSIALLEYLFPIGLITTVIILTIPFSLLWSMFLKQGKAYFKETLGHFKNQLPKMSDQFAIFLSAGFFVTALQITGSNQSINQAVTSLDHLIGSTAFIMILPLIPLLLAFLGMHPALAIGLLAESLDPVTLGITPEQMALALLGGAVSTFLLGPFNATSGIMASIVKVSPFRIVSWNVGYSLAFLILIAITLLMM